MIQPWSAIVDSYRRTSVSGNDSHAFQQAVDAVGALAAHIEETSLGAILFGWRSMFDLCIQQIDLQPYSGPYLRISPLQSGNVEFRYFDTQIASRQWHREVAAKDTILRLNKFLEQLRWVASAPQAL